MNMENEPIKPKSPEENVSVGENIETREKEWGIESPEKLSWLDAWDYCKNLGEGWKLPKPEEIKSALSEKTINAQAGAKYWSSYHYGNSSSWYGLDEEGNVVGDYDSKGNANNVIPVKD